MKLSGRLVHGCSLREYCTVKVLSYQRMLKILDELPESDNVDATIDKAVEIYFKRVSLQKEPEKVELTKTNNIPKINKKEPKKYYYKGELLARYCADNEINYAYVIRLITVNKMKIEEAIEWAKRPSNEKRVQSRQVFSENNLNTIQKLNDLYFCAISRAGEAIINKEYDEALIILQKAVNGELHQEIGFKLLNEE